MLGTKLEPPPGLSHVGVLSDYGGSAGPAGGPETTQQARTASDEDRITPAVEDETVDGQTQPKAPLCKQEIILLALNFTGEHTDAVLRRALKARELKVSSSRTEHITRAYLSFRVTLISEEAAGELFRECVKDGLCLFKDYNTWLEMNRSSVKQLTDVPADADLMRTFRPV